MKLLNRNAVLVAILVLLSTSLSSSVFAKSYTRYVFHDGLIRSFRVTVPSSYNDMPVPLVLDIHGGTSSVGRQFDMSGFAEVAEKEGFIIVHPKGFGLLGSWNAFQCCFGAQILGLDDVGLMRKIVKRVAREWAIDSSRVYATGISNGGNLAHRLACEASDMIAGIASISMPLHAPEGECEDANPMTVVTYAGTKDKVVVPYQGGWVAPAAEALKRWADLNGCTQGPFETLNTGDAEHDMVCNTYSNCLGGVENTYCQVEEGEHVLYKTTNVNIAEHAWSILKQHVR